MWIIFLILAILSLISGIIYICKKDKQSKIIIMSMVLFIFLCVSFLPKKAEDSFIYQYDKYYTLIERDAIESTDDIKDIETLNSIIKDARKKSKNFVIKDSYKCYAEYDYLDVDKAYEIYYEYQYKIGL